jgi:ABC-type branched-subunit amino acid transport system substrate-binding protein
MYTGMMGAISIRRVCLALLVLASFAIVACGGGDSGASPTPNGGGDGSPAKALLVIGSPSEVNGILKAAVALDKVDMYLLTSLSQDPAAFDGVTFTGSDTAWGVQLLGPQEGTAAAFNSAYTDRFGAAPSGAAWHAYDAVYTIALAAVAANSTSGEAIKNNVAYVANSPGFIAGYGSDGFGGAKEKLASADGDVNYVGASGQVDIDVSGGMSKGTAQTWKVLNGNIAPIETRDVDLAAEAGDEVPTGSLNRAQGGPSEALNIGLLLANDTAAANAAQLAVDEINAAGGVSGQDIVLHSETPADGGEAASVNALVQAGARAIIGPVTAAAVSPALDAAKAAKVPLFALSDSPGLSALASDGFLFNFVPSLAVQMPVLANLALESEANVFCVLYAQGTSGEAMAAAFQKAAEHKEAKVKSNQSFDPAAGDHSQVLSSCLG